MDDALKSGLHPSITLRMEQSERDGGIWKKDVAIGACVVVQTQNTKYRIERRAEDEWLISGHAKYCPAPVKCCISGSTWGGSMLKVGFIGIGMHLEFVIPEFPGCITTTMIRSVEMIPVKAEAEDALAKLSS